MGLKEFKNNMKLQLWFLLLTLHLCSAYQYDVDDPFTLHTAASIGDLQKVMELLKGGAQINQQNRGWAYTPLHYAAQNGRPNVVQHLLEKGADKNKPNYKADTALNLARIRECDIYPGNSICTENCWDYDETVTLLEAGSENRATCQLPSEKDTNVTIIKYSTEQKSNCGNQVLAGTQAMVSCWQSPSIIVSCTNSDNSWSICNTDSCEKPKKPLVHLCKQEAPNAKYCGYRPPYSPAPSNVTRQQWPWLVEILVNDQYVCTGTIISAFYVLTAAHCMTGSSPRNVKLKHEKDDEISKSTIKKIIRHHAFKTGDRPENDICLLQLVDAITFSKTVMPACIAVQQPAQTESAVTFNLDSRDLKLQEVHQEFYSRCQISSGGNSCQQIKDRQFCSTTLKTGSTSALGQGSSGSPYIVNMGTEEQEQQSVFGVVSYNVPQGSCDEKYTVYTEVTAFSNWIKETIEKK